MRALAGLQVGILGGLVMLSWFGLDSWFHREYFWKVPHLLASSFYGERIFHRTFGMMTVAGMAMQLAGAGLLGVLFGMAMVRPPGFARLGLIAVLTAMSWYWASQEIFWRRWLPLLPLYTTQSSMFVAHLLYGICLAQYRARARQLLRDFATPSVI